MREEVSWPCGLGVPWSASEIIPRSPLNFSQSPDIALSPERTMLYGLRKFLKVIHDASTPPALVDDYRSQVTTDTALPISHLTTPAEKQVWKQWVQDENLSLCKIFIIHKETTLYQGCWRVMCPYYGCLGLYRVFPNTCLKFRRPQFDFCIGVFIDSFAS